MQTLRRAARRPKFTDVATRDGVALRGLPMVQIARNLGVSPPVVTGPARGDLLRGCVSAQRLDPCAGHRAGLRCGPVFSAVRVRVVLDRPRDRRGVDRGGLEHGVRISNRRGLAGLSPGRRPGQGRGRRGRSDRCGWVCGDRYPGSGPPRLDVAPRMNARPNKSPRRARGPRFAGSHPCVGKHSAQ